MKPNHLFPTTSKLIALCGLALGSSGALYAATAVDTFQVTVQVLDSCTVSAADLDFGSYNGALNDSSADITVNCTGQTPYAVALDGGTSANTAARVMTGVTHATTLNYQLYSDGPRTSVFGTGAEDVDGTGSGSDQTLTVYGRIPASQLLTADNYADTITVTVTY